jgi:hypothetical protein
VVGGEYRSLRSEDSGPVHVDSVGRRRAFEVLRESVASLDRLRDGVVTESSWAWTAAGRVVPASCEVEEVVVLSGEEGGRRDLEGEGRVRGMGLVGEVDCLLREDHLLA